MNKLLLLAAFLLSAHCPARSQPFRYADPEPAAPRRNPLAQRATTLTAQYTDALRLTTRQRVAVRRCVAQYLEQVDVLDWHLTSGTLPNSTPDALATELQVSLRYVLSPRQYEQLLWLELPLSEVSLAACL